MPACKGIKKKNTKESHKSEILHHEFQNNIIKIEVSYIIFLGLQGKKKKEAELCHVSLPTWEKRSVSRWQLLSCTKFQIGDDNLRVELPEVFYCEAGLFLNFTSLSKFIKAIMPRRGLRWEF